MKARAKQQKNKRRFSGTALNAAQKEKKPKPLVNEGLTAFANKKSPRKEMTSLYQRMLTFMRKASNKVRKHG